MLVSGCRGNNIIHLSFIGKLPAWPYPHDSFLKIKRENERDTFSFVLRFPDLTGDFPADAGLKYPEQIVSATCIKQEENYQ